MQPSTIKFVPNHTLAIKDISREWRWNENYKTNNATPCTRA